MTEFNEGWWNCFNSFANNTRSDYDSVCMEVLNGAGVTKEEAEEIIQSGNLYGMAVNILKNYIKQMA